MSAQARDMELETFTYELLDLLAATADDAEARQVRAVSAPGVALVLDYDEILAH